MRRVGAGKALRLFSAALLVVASLVASVVTSQSPAFAQDLGDHRYTSEAIQEGLSIYSQQCALCHGPQGDLVDGVDLRLGVFRTVQSDADLSAVITNGAAEGRMPAFDFNAGQLSAITAYIRAGFNPEGVAIRVGDAVRGKTLFEGRGECSTCHRVDGVGARTAPDLSDVGLRRTPENLQLNLVDPSTALLPINRPIRAVTRSEEVITGRRLNEDTYSVQLIDSVGQLRSLIKDDLVSYTISEQASKAPTSLNNDEVADVVAYLLSLRGVRLGVQ